MNAEKVKKWIAENNIGAIEDAWMSSMQDAPHEQLHSALEALVAAGKEETAQTLTSLAISERNDDSQAGALELAKALLPALPANDELREMAADLFRGMHGEDENFEEFLRASGLTANQSLRRAIRTLSISLEAAAGKFMANRYDHRVIRMDCYNAVMGCFEATAADGAMEQYEPKLLADEFLPVEEDDFRVLCQFRADMLGQLLNGEPAKLLTGMCMAHGGKINAAAMKDALVPRYVEKEKWSSWWTSARNAARKSDVLSITGRNPAVIEHHPEGRPLEDDFATAAAKARTPLAAFHVLQGYARELKSRSRQADSDFLMPILANLAAQSVSFRTRRPVDALTACLALETAERMSLPVPAERPTVADMLADLADPADAIARVNEPALWPAAFDALAPRTDAATQFERLMGIMPLGQLDEIAERLDKAGGSDGIARVIEQSATDPKKYLQICLWLWRGPAKKHASAPPLLELLSRLLNLMQELHRDVDAHGDNRRDMCQQVSSVMSASNFKSFRGVIGQMNRDVAETFKRRIDRSEGLSPTCREDMLAILREDFYELFVEAKVVPWLDETIIWTTDEALSRRQAEYKELVEITIPANSRAVGAAADLGDLSENSEWQYAVEEQRRLLAKASIMQNDLALARILHEGDAPSDSVGIGSKVGLKRIDDGKELSISILGPWDTNVQARVVSYRTQLAQDMCGKGIGESVFIKMEGDEGEYVIDTIGSALIEGHIH